MENSLNKRVRDFFREKGEIIDLHVFDETTRTSVDAAKALNCNVAQIAKSIVFVGKKDRRPYVVIASGANKVSSGKLKRLVGQDCRIARPEEVLAHTGFEVGGVPAAGHTRPITTFMDEDLMKYEVVWTAGGTANCVFPIEPAKLLEISGAQVCDVKI